MILHLVPRIFLPTAYANSVQLVGVSLPDFGLTLKAGEDVVARRPYPNKRYLVACRLSGSKAYQGLVVEGGGPLRSFTCTTTWVSDDKTQLTHHVVYEVLDSDFEAVSDDMLLWMGVPSAAASYTRRWPKAYDGLSPVDVQPRMDVCPGVLGGTAARPQAVDVLNDDHLVIVRKERFIVPTIEPDRIFGMGSTFPRLPRREHAFVLP